MVPRSSPLTSSGASIRMKREVGKRRQTWPLARGSPAGEPTFGSASCTVPQGDWLTGPASLKKATLGDLFPAVKHYPSLTVNISQQRNPPVFDLSTRSFFARSNTERSSGQNPLAAVRAVGTAFPGLDGTPAQQIRFHPATAGTGCRAATAQC